MRQHKIFALMLSVALLLTAVIPASASVTEESYESVVSEVNEKYDLDFEFCNDGGMTVPEFKAWLTEIAIANQRNHKDVNTEISLDNSGIMPMSELDFYRGNDGVVEISCYIRFDSSSKIVGVQDISSKAVQSTNSFTQTSSSRSINSSGTSVTVTVVGTMEYKTSAGIVIGTEYDSRHSCTFYA